MQVEVHLFGPLREAVGTKTVVVALDAAGTEGDESSSDGAAAEPSTVGDALAALVEAHPSLAEEVLTGNGTIPSGVNVTHEGTDVRHLEGAATPVVDGDVLRAAPPVVGGAPPVVEGAPSVVDGDVLRAAPPVVEGAPSERAPDAVTIRLRNADT